MFKVFAALLCSFQLLLGCHCNAQNEKKNELATFFDDVLLIINFNHPYYGNIKFLKEIYGPYFKHIVFYGEQSGEEVNVIAHRQGYFSNQALSDVMQKWPNFNGYILCQDDCFMNFWNYTRLDKNKIWFHHYETAPLSAPQLTWNWWNFPHGRTAMIMAYGKMPIEKREMLNINCGLETVAYIWSDFVYIPGCFRKDFIALNNCCSNPHVFIEIAIPTILLCLDKKENIEQLNVYWAGQNIDLNIYHTSYDWMHPIKFSSVPNQEFIRRVVKSISEDI